MTKHEMWVIPRSLVGLSILSHSCLVIFRHSCFVIRHSCRPGVIAVIMILAPILPASAQETPVDWIRRLGSRNYADREKAARALEQLGKPALAALREAMNHADLETKRRAILVMGRIEDRLIQEELTQATPVRLRFENMSVDEALREVEKQIGLRCGNAFGKGRISKIDTGVLPYWQTWRKFCSAAQLSESDYALSAAKLKRMGENDVQQLFGMLNRERIEINSIYAASLSPSTTCGRPTQRVIPSYSTRLPPTSSRTSTA